MWWGSWESNEWNINVIGYNFRAFIVTNCTSNKKGWEQHMQGYSKENKRTSLDQPTPSTKKWDKLGCARVNLLVELDGWLSLVTKLGMMGDHPGDGWWGLNFFELSLCSKFQVCSTLRSGRFWWGFLLLLLFFFLFLLLWQGENKVNSLSDLDWTVELGLEFDNMKEWIDVGFNLG